jgi:glycosyltransferase involved in cell wall biosynthesis
MRIAVEAWAAAEVPAGRGRYLRELLRAIAALETEHEIVLLGREPWEEVPFEWRLGPARPWEVARAARGFDVLFAPTSYLACALSPVPSVGVVFDMVVFDKANKPPRGAFLERLTLPLAVRRANKLLCISEATRTALLTRYPRSRAVTTLLAAGAGFADAQPAQRPRPYILSAATLEPRKNLPRLIEAFAQLPDTHDLVLVGTRGWRNAELDAAIERHDVVVTGFVSDDELKCLYAGADAVAYPSLEEGFGFPILEAMTAGTPVLTSDRSSMPEVGGDAAVYCDPTSVESIRDGLVRVLADRERLIAAGRERAKLFSWERCARETLAYLTSTTSTLEAGNSRPRNEPS